MPEILYLTPHLKYITLLHYSREMLLSMIIPKETSLFRYSWKTMAIIPLFHCKKIHYSYSIIPLQHPNRVRFPKEITRRKLYLQIGNVAHKCTSHLKPSHGRGHSLSVSAKASEVPGHQGKNTEWSPCLWVLSCTNHKSPVHWIGCDSLF